MKIEFNDIQKAYLKQVKDKFDTRLSVALQSITQFEKDYDFLKYSTNEETDPYTITKVAEKISRSINAFSSLGYTIAFSRNSPDSIISAYRTEPFDDYFLKRGFSNATIENLRKNLSNNDIKEIYYTIPREGSSKSKEDEVEFIILYRKKFLNNTTMNFFISFLPDNTVDNTEPLKKESFLIVKNDYIINSQHTAHQESLIPVLKNLGVLPLKKAELYDSVDLKSNLVHIYRSDVFADLSYIYIIPQKTSFYKIDLLISVVVSFVVLLLFGSWIVLSNTRRIYLPIREVADVFKRYESEEDSDELEYIKKAAEKISHTNDELFLIVKNKSENLKSKLLSNVLYGVLKEENIEHIIDEYGLQKFMVPLRVAVIELLDPLELEERMNKEKIIEIKDGILRYITSAFEKAGNCLIFELDYKRYAAITTETDIEAIRNVLNTTLYKIEVTYDIELMAAIGKEVHSLVEAENSFNHAMLISEHKHIFNKKSVLTDEDLQGIKDISYYYPIDIERNLLLYITNGEREKANALLKNLLNINFHQNTLSKESIAEFIYAIVATIKRLLQQMNMTADEVFGEDCIVYLELKTCQNIEQLEDKIKEMFNTIIFRMHSDNMEEDQSLIEKITNYVRENYQRDISLTDISDAYNISMGYASRLFKQQIKTNFKDYLSMYRVQKAKEMFNHGKSIKINVIAKDVGYNNVSTFIRIFKKYEGISPGEYIKNMD